MMERGRSEEYQASIDHRDNLCLAEHRERKK